MSEKSPVNYLQRLIISSPDPLKSNDNHKLELQIQAYLKDQFLFKLKNCYSQFLKLETADLSQCLIIPQKVAFNIVSEAKRATFTFTKVN